MGPGIADIDFDVIYIDYSGETTLYIYFPEPTKRVYIQHDTAAPLLRILRW